MVYDADGGVVGEVRYVVGHLLGRAACDLCDITHGTVRRKATFAALISELPVPVNVLHRNEQTPELAAFTSGHLACIVAHTDDGPEVLVDRTTLSACAGRVDCLAEILRPLLAERT